jgi:hypothetical protein
MLTSDNYDITASGAQFPWHIDPLRCQKYDDNRLTTIETWWESDNEDNTITTSVEDSVPIITFSYEENLISYFGINLEGCDLVKFTFDEDWVLDDFFEVDFKVSNPDSIESIIIKLGRDNQAYWRFVITEGFSSSWTTFSQNYKSAYAAGKLMRVFDRYYNAGEMDSYIAPKLPRMYDNFGFLEIIIIDDGSNQVSFKNFKNKRCSFENTIEGSPSLFLGLKDLVLIPPLGVSSIRGTVEFKWLPSEGPIGMSRGEMRSFILSLLTLRGSNGTGYSVTYKPVEGWNIYVFNQQTNYNITQRNTQLWEYYNAYEEQILINRQNPGPFSIVLSWDANGLPGLYENIALWINNVLVLSENNYLVTQYPSDSMSLTLGKSLSNFSTKDSSILSPYGSFSDLKVYNYSVGGPNTLRTTSRKPEDYLQLSLDGIAWADLTNGLPLVVKDVPSGDSVTFYTRAKHFNKQAAVEFLRRTGYIVVEWSYD